MDGKIEQNLTDFVARVAPWLSPLPTAYLTATATVRHLAWPWSVGIVAGAIIECLGLAATSTALTLRAYNQTKRKSDPSAPFALALSLVGVYFASVTALTVVLDTLPGLAAFAPLVFPVMSLAGVSVLAIRSDHKRRLAAIAGQKAEARAKRRARLTGQAVSRVGASDRSGAVSLGQEGRNGRSEAGQEVTDDRSFDRANRARRSAKKQALTDLVTFYAENPGASYRVAGEAVGRSKAWIVGAVKELAASGKLRKNGHGIEVLP